MHTSVTNSHRITWSLADISEATGLSINFLRYEVRRGNLSIKKFGRRVLVRAEDLQKYIETGSEGSKAASASNAE